MFTKESLANYRDQPRTVIFQFLVRTHFQPIAIVPAKASMPVISYKQLRDHENFVRIGRHQMDISRKHSVLKMVSPPATLSQISRRRPLTAGHLG